MRLEIGHQVLEALEVGVVALSLRVRHEHNAIRSCQHELAGRVEVHLTGDGEELEPDVMPPDAGGSQRQEVEVQRAIHGRGERHDLTSRLSR